MRLERSCNSKRTYPVFINSIPHLTPEKQSWLFCSTKSEPQTMLRLSCKWKTLKSKRINLNKSNKNSSWKDNFLVSVSIFPRRSRTWKSRWTSLSQKSSTFINSLFTLTHPNTHSRKETDTCSSDRYRPTKKDLN